MRKILFLLLALTMAVGASAGGNSWQDRHEVMKQKQAMTQTGLDRFKSYAKAHKAKTAAPQLRGATSPYSQQPEGEVRIYKRSGQCIRWHNENDIWVPMVTHQAGKVKIIYDPDGETVYIENPISGIYDITTWARGTIQGGKIHVPMGQVLLHIDDPSGDFDGLLEWGTAVGQTDWYNFIQDTTVTEATFTIDGDNFYLDNSSGGVDGDGAVGMAVMYTNNNHMEGLDWNTGYTPYTPPTLLYDQPDGELVTYSYLSSYYYFYDNYVYANNTLANFVYAPDGETVYMQFYDEAPWMTATIVGNKIHLPLGQYVYYEEDTYFGGIIAWGSVGPGPNGFGGQFVQDNTVTEATFTIQDDFIILDNSSGGNNGMGAVGLAEITDDGTDCYLEWGLMFAPYVEPSVIDEQPEGELKTYTRSGYSINYNGDVYDQGGLVNIIYAPDGQTVYIQNPISSVNEDTWVMGTIENGKLHVPMRQYIYWDDEYWYGIMLAMGQAYYNNYSNQIMLNFDPTLTEATFTINGDVISLDNTCLGPYDDAEGAMVLAAVYSDGANWMVGCDLLTVFTSIEVIDEQPEGNLMQYVRHGNWIYESGSIIPVDGLMDIVYAPDGETVYIKDLISYSQNGTWVRGTLEDGIITVPVGQLLSTEGKYNTLLAYGKMAHDQSIGRYVFTPIDGKTAIQYIIEDGEIYLMDGWYSGSVYQGPAAMQDGTYYAQGVEYQAYYTPYNGPTVITSQPNGDLVSYLRAGSGFYRNEELSKKGDRYIYAPDIKGQGGEVNVVYAHDGQTVYLQDPVYSGYQFNRGTWVRGTLSDNGTKIHVPLGQYVSWDMYYETGDVLAWGSTSLQDYYGDLDLVFTPDPNVTEVTYTIDNGCIYLDNTQGGSYVDYRAMQDLYYNGDIDYETFEQMVAPWYVTTGIAYLDGNGNWTGESNWGTVYVSKHPTTLPDPEIYDWRDYNNENGNNRFDVEVPTVDTEGLPIFEDALSYSIYTDYDKLFTFEASRYGLDEDVTEVTYDMWQDCWRLDPHAGIRFYRTNAEGFEPFFKWRIGIQYHYTVDGIKQSSNIVYLEVFEKPTEPEVPGDVNGDSEFNISDVTNYINYILNDGAEVFYDENADFNNDGEINITDVIDMINYILNNI